MTLLGAERINDGTSANLCEIGWCKMYFDVAVGPCSGASISTDVIEVHNYLADYGLFFGSLPLNKLTR